MPDIVLLAHNIRSTHNIGAIFRSAEGFGVSTIIVSGYSPYPELPNDSRLPHIVQKISSHIHKTALGAEAHVAFEYRENPPIQELRARGYRVVALEQAKTSQLLQYYRTPEKVAILLGEEVHGVTDELLAACDDIVEIPMFGKKESFNVSVAAGIALYQLVVVGVK